MRTKEQIREGNRLASKKWYSKNKEVQKKKMLDYYYEKLANDPEYKAKRVEITKRYVEAHREEIAARKRERYRTDPEFRERNLAAGRKWYKNNKAKQGANNGN